MRLPGSRTAEAALLSTFLLPFITGVNGVLDCGHVLAGGAGGPVFDLSPLDGPQSVVDFVDKTASSLNTTYTIDICRPLKKAKSVPAKIQCPNGARICAIQRVITKDPPSDTLGEVWAVAGDLRTHGGGDLDVKTERLKNSQSSSDAEKEGVRITMNGGFKKEEENGKTNKRDQKAVIEFECDRERTGLENLPKPEDPYTDPQTDDKKKREIDSTPSLQFLKYSDEDGMDVLRLKWNTKYACEDAKDELDKQKGQHWGFFTWFIIIAFLSTATYLIFGSWLNYNRYGARGWDLLPHGDTIRDVPYLLKDWMRRVLNTVQGGGSRGGYAAV